MDTSRIRSNTRRVSAQREAGSPSLDVDARETSWNDRAALVDAILAAAALRDDRAAIREFEAEQRDQAANLDAFVEGVDDGPAFRARQLARGDRASAKADRIAAELDRYVLSDLSASPEEHGEASASRAGSDTGPLTVMTSGTESRRAHVV
jgi:hypothetical protein